MRYIGTISSDARGKLGGIVFSRAVGGTTMKAHKVPLQPRTPNQQMQRSSFAGATSMWKQINTSDRTSWATIAVQLTYINSLGQTYTPTGFQLFVQAYSNARYAGTYPFGTAPFTLPVIPSVDSITATNSGSTLVLEAFLMGSPYTGSWIVSASTPVSVAVNYIRNVPRRPVGFSNGSATLDVTDAYFNQWGSIPVAGTFIVLRVVSFDPDSFISGTPALVLVEVFT